MFRSLQDGVDAVSGSRWFMFPGSMAAGLLCLLSGCGLGGPAHGPPVSGAAATVSMTNSLAFDPASVTIHRGDIVEWRNTALFHHTVTDEPRKTGGTNDMGLPPGAPPFDSGNIPAGEIYTHRFTVPGTYRYACLYHEGDGMTGTVIVLPAP